MSKDNETVIQELPVKLDQEELRLKGEELGEAINERKVAEREFSEVKKHWKTKIDLISEKIDDLARTTRTGIEYREIACKIRYDYGAGKVYMDRMDTGETVKSRKMTDADRQESL